MSWPTTRPFKAGFGLTAAGSQKREVNQANAVYEVNSAYDTDDGTCDLTYCSLREAIDAANNVAGVDNITFNLSPNATIVLSGTQLPLIVDHVSIDGSTAENLTVSGNNANNIFAIDISKAVTVPALTLANGNALPGDGGAIYNNGLLTLVNSDIISNSARNGGGIYNRLGTVNLLNGTVSDNAATSQGGGIYGRLGTIILKNSDLISNTADSNNGGGIYSWSSSLILSSTTLMGNFAFNFGGGIYNALGNLKVSASTVNGNLVTGSVAD